MRPNARTANRGALILTNHAWVAYAVGELR
jgi:hypothetical protein